VWRTAPWDATTYLGEPIDVAPTDLFAYQEAIATARPDWIVETGSGFGARTRYLADVCELVGHGTVLTVGTDPIGDRIEHPRVRHVEGVPHAQSTIDAVREVVGEGTAIVLLGTRGEQHPTTAEFIGYSPMVPPGSWVIVERTVVNGHPVWAGHGPGPGEAVKQILTLHGDFVADASLEKHSLSFNAGGFLRRVR
jgi:cephalosporin hydroxylase